MPQRDRIAIRILRQRGTPQDGVTTLRVDLADFFRAVARVGRDPALLLLTLRALRQRSGGGGVRLHDLRWIMGASPRRLRGWLDQLVAAECLVYDATNGSMDVELPEPTGPAWTDLQPPHIALRHELPTHWFVLVLPRLGRAAFVAYLYLLSRDGIRAPSTLALAALARDAAFRTQLHARWHLRRLRTSGLIVPDVATHALVILDPPPLTPAGRRWLRRRRMGESVPRWMWLALAVVLLVALVLFALSRTAISK